MRLLIMVLLFSWGLKTQAQADTIEIPYKEVLNWPEEFSAKVDFGVGTITNSFADEVDNLKVNNGVAGNLGLVWVHHYNGASLFRMEFAFMHVQSSETMEAFSYTTESGREIVYEDNTVNKSVTYISLPILYGLEFSRIYINGGIQGSMMMSGKGHTVNREVNLEYDLTDKEFAEFDFGFKGILGFRFARHLFAEFSYYHGIGNVCSKQGDTVGQTWNLRQLTFGIRYSFHYYKPDQFIDFLEEDELDW